jgi:DNA-binding GntR family transcriptional regulator
MNESRATDTAEQRLYRAVFDAVMAQRLAPGTRLTEAALCELFGVKRATVRKVLQRLALEHMVDLRPNRGAVVATPSPEETRQVFEARRALEASLLGLAVQHATRADIAALRQQLGTEHAAMHHSGQAEWARLASSFHLQVAALGRNPILLRYLNELVSRCSLIVALYEPPGNAACEHDEHSRIVDAIEARQTTAALALMDEHLRELEQRIRLDRPPSPKSLGQMLGLA